MVDSFVQLQTDGTGKKVDATEVTVGGNIVERQRIQIAGSTPTSLVEPDAGGALPVSATFDYRFSGGKLPYVTTLAASGNTTLITPTLGNRLQVYWVSFVPSSDNTSANLIRIGFGTSGGSIDAGQELYRGYAMAHWELFTGLVNKSIIVNAATIEPVVITIHYKEII